MPRFEAEKNPKEWLKKYWTIGALVVLAGVFVYRLFDLVEWVGDEEWATFTFLNGEVEVVDTPGWHAQWFAEVRHYPRYVDAYYSRARDEGGKEDHSIRVTFNDGGWGHTSHHVRFALPTDRENRLKLDQHFGGRKDPVEAIKRTIEAHLTTCAKNTGPLMSASEHQSEGRARYYQIVDEQLRQGLYEMVRVREERESDHELTLSGKEIIYVTKIKRDADGMPIINADSPLSEYNFDVAQYNQTDVDYDQDTLALIDAKRDSYQKAEQARAATIKEQQKLREAEAQGKLNVADVEAAENQKKKTATVAAEKELEQAKINQEEEVVIASQSVAVAEQELAKTEKDLEISEIQLKTAQHEGEERIALAEAKQQQLQRGGELAEEDKVRAELIKRRNAAVAKFVSQMPAPKYLILGEGGTGEAGPGGSPTAQQDPLMKLLMLKMLGLNP